MNVQTSSGNEPSSPCELFHLHVLTILINFDLKAKNLCACFGQSITRIMDCLNPSGHWTYNVPTVRTMYVHCTYSACWDVKVTSRQPEVVYECIYELPTTVYCQTLYRSVELWKAVHGPSAAERLSLLPSFIVSPQDTYH